ncbi:hypothetical protein O6H91_04G069500 [Diphasiastrum complanatum]|uniref:Uncharacterized protein n=1 Tax=Diphasiastrum complanatum TaxID=34168 RepID=A0ACC2DY29_DIPCM|nr:hypothetical protein O6H91_04G069500 [Diphasiastrum complanatum]
MEKRVSKENIKLMRDVVGLSPSEMDIIHALHLARNNLEKAINILLDTPGFQKNSSRSLVATFSAKGENFSPSENAGPSSLSNSAMSPMSCLRHSSLPTFSSTTSGSGRVVAKDAQFLLIHQKGNGMPKSEFEMRSSPLEDEWWLLDVTDVEGYSTCKGTKLKVGDNISFTYPKQEFPDKMTSKMKRPWGRGKPSSEIVRFSTVQGGEVGRLPGDWARCLIPLVHLGLAKLDAVCKSAPSHLSLMDSIVLSIRLFINRALFKSYNDLQTSSVPSSIEGTTNHPLPILMFMLGKKPFRKAEFSPEDLYNQRSFLDSGPFAHFPDNNAAKRQKVASDLSSAREDQEEEVSALSDSEVTKFVGMSNSCDLKEMEPSSNLECELRPYQKQALFWMANLEAGNTFEDAAEMLHPCWAGYYLADKRSSAFYINVFSGEATLDFPSALQTAKGGILADAMGLGKTVMTIALILTNCGKGGFSSEKIVKVEEDLNGSVPHSSLDSLDLPSNEMFKKEVSNASLSFKKRLRKGGGTLIVCPMTLLGQWKTEFENHVIAGVLSVYAHYGTDRCKDPKFLLKHDVVLTTYGILQSEYDPSNSGEDGPLHSVHWFRIVLDEAHTIKASRSLSAQAVFRLMADRRWCLTGTPVQNKLEDIFSLLHFLRVEPWSNWGWWNKLIQRPHEEGQPQGLKLLQSILKPLMLRRTKDSTDRDGRPILVLPPAETQVIECELSEAERDFYNALFHKSKVKFDKFVEQGRVLHNYASILELLLRLRQCCDHPFLVFSRGDTGDYADLDKLAKRFMNGGRCDGDDSFAQGPTKAYIQEVVDDLRKGDKAECPICLEAVEDAVLTPCAHCMCRECLFASWRSSGSGACPLCRQTFNKQELVTVPTSSRFRVDIEKNWTESSKVTSLLQQLESLKKSGAKSIVISQWTSFLDLLEIPFNRQKLKYARLDGTLSQQQREGVIKEFSCNSDISVLLISLKAGGVGINLTAASNAFLLDPWWNPAVEEQAIMRIHRIGQTKKVSIKRFIVKVVIECASSVFGPLLYS